MKTNFTHFLGALSLMCMPYFSHAQCTPATDIKTFAGDHTNGTTGDGGPATAAQLSTPFGIVADAAGNVYVADYNHHVVRMIDPTGVITKIAGNGTGGYNGDGISADTASLFGPAGLALDAAGNLYIADKYNER